MKIKGTTKTKGFTIIEVVLVLAIAGLIFMMVFIALPALQKSQRDTQRKNDLSRIMTQITTYSSSNRGLIPTDLSFVKNYLGGPSTTTGVAGADYLDPSTGTGYVIFLSASPGTTIGGIGYYKASKCGVDGAVINNSASTPVNARNFALTMVLESQASLYCVDNQ